ncbi:pyrroline-5-carboxylate reductase [Halanaerobacter jeridensis]|uniref:Pyrroline-5-carboxylate reductase n=1 Tax=Halanaerobacter jeridensis TaxID=706427 RepID=A0A938XQI9_9FIRM|nr:pyrroline-5-carboxylate reductase [Halanaerobacter jeridensis]MBM7555468.1 pyrroline-5-carboxylate reductase [Halanaerobacter jeridensis]
MIEEKVGFIGAGSMAEALIEGLLEQQIIAPDDLYISDINKSRLDELTAKYEINQATTNNALVSKADYIILAVKPQVIGQVLEEVGPKITAQQTVFSIAAGVETNQIEANLDQVPVVRLMPNTAALIGEAAIAYSLGSYAGKETAAVVEELFSASGTVTKVKENLMDAVTGLSGSGPAYIYLIIEALSDAGVNMGLPREKSTELTLQTIIGAAKMVKESDLHPGELKDMVTSPGGTTIKGMQQLEESGVRGILYNTVEAAANKSQELKKE